MALPFTATCSDSYYAPPTQGGALSIVGRCLSVRLSRAWP